MLTCYTVHAVTAAARPSPADLHQASQCTSTRLLSMRLRVQAVRQATPPPPPVPTAVQMTKAEMQALRKGAITRILHGPGGAAQGMRTTLLARLASLVGAPCLSMLTGCAAHHCEPPGKVTADDLHGCAPLTVGDAVCVCHRVFPRRRRETGWRMRSCSSSWRTLMAGGDCSWRSSGSRLWPSATATGCALVGPHLKLQQHAGAGGSCFWAICHLPSCTRSDVEPPCCSAEIMHECACMLHAVWGARQYLL